MKKLNLISLALLAGMLAINSAHAASTGDSCSLQNYDEAISAVKKFNKAEWYIVGIPAAAGLGILWLASEGEILSPWPYAAGGALLGVGGAFYGSFYLVKKFEARHFQEVVNNLIGAEDGAGHDAIADKAIDHTTDLIDKQTKGHYTAVQVGQAIKAALAAGALCRSDGTLAVTDNFRSIIETYLNAQQTVLSMSSN